MGLLLAAWWGARMAMVGLSLAFYAYFAVDRAYGMPCDAPLLGYIVSVGVISSIMLLLRTGVFAVGIDEKPSDTMRFLLLYPVVLHGIEMAMAAAAGGYILLPNEQCTLPLSASYVNWASVLMVCSWLVAGLIYPLSFDTKPEYRTQRHGAGFRTVAGGLRGGAALFMPSNQSQIAGEGDSFPISRWSIALL